MPQCSGGSGDKLDGAENIFPLVKQWKIKLDRQWRALSWKAAARQNGLEFILQAVAVGEAFVKLMVQQLSLAVHVGWVPWGETGGREAPERCQGLPVDLAWGSGRGRGGRQATGVKIGPQFQGVVTPASCSLPFSSCPSVSTPIPTSQMLQSIKVLPSQNHPHKLQVNLVWAALSGS